MVEGIKVGGIANEFEEGRRPVVAVKGSGLWRACSFEACSTGDEESGRGEVQKLMDEMFDVFVHAKAICLYTKRFEDCERLVTDETRETLTKE